MGTRPLCTQMKLKEAGSQTDVGRPKQKKSDYGADQIQVLEGLEPVRRRPGMYIGTTGPKGLHHLVFEVVDNSIDEALAGFCTRILVEILPDGSVRVTDDGRGIPTEIHPATGKSAVETVLTVLHAGGKFGGGGYKVSGGLHGVGISVVNALSEHLEINVWREGNIFTQTYKRGIAQSPLQSAPSDSTRTGTQVHFKPDPLIFKTSLDFDYDSLSTRLRELAYLNAGVHITLTQRPGDRSTASSTSSSSSVTDASSPNGVVHPAVGRTEEYHFQGGIREYVTYLTDEKTRLHDEVVYVEGEDKGMHVSVAMQWCADYYSENLLGFANSIRTTDGGTHLDALKTVLTRTVNTFARKNNRLKEGMPNLSGDFIREGLTAIISVKVPNPEFQGQTKTRLGNPEVRPVVDTIVGEALAEFLELRPQVANLIVDKALQAYNAAEAARRARELVRRKTVLESSALPGKLADCSSRDPSECEVFIVEGDSAGGSAKQARDRRFQAILPLRGKILNIEKTEDSKMYKNSEIQALITGLGLGIKGELFDPSRLRYHRVVLLTDADVDGSHIRTLLLTFFYRYQRPLVDAGHIYIACPPLYKVERGKSSTYCYNDADLRRVLDDLPPNASPNIQRFKGLGEMMPEQLWQTTLNPQTRRLKQVCVEDAVQAELMFSTLMGTRVGPRKLFIEKYGPQLNRTQLDI